MVLDEFKKSVGEVFKERYPENDASHIQAMIKGFLDALAPLGIITHPVTGETTYSSTVEFFLESYLFFFRKNHSLITDWERIGGEFKNPEDLFDKGVRLLSLFEKKRSQFEGAYPLKELKVVKALIRAKDVVDKEYFLMHLDEKSHYYQMIGGKIKNNESPLDALLREMNEEIPNFNLKHDKDFSIIELDQDFNEISFVSPKYGVITKYFVKQYYIQFIKPLQLKGSLRWVSKEELSIGVTEDGFGLIPPADEFKSVYKKIPEKIFSFSESIQISDTKINVGEKFENKQKLNSFMAISLLGEGEDVIDHNKCFVIMPYSESWSAAVEQIIEEVCQKNDLFFILAKNMDGRFIPNDIWKGITGAGLIIADLTGGNPNVTYEVGLADVLGKNTILICQDTKIPFDFSGQRLLMYENSIGGTLELKKKLNERIKSHKQTLK